MGTAMTWLVGWHSRIGRAGLRLLALHLLWINWTLRGGIVLGVFPATAAVYAVIRRDILTPEHGVRVRLRTHFGTTWRTEFAAANRLGYLLVIPWAILVINRQLVAVVDFGASGPVLAGLLTVLGVVLFAVSVNVWILAAHFDEGALAMLRRALTLIPARPAIAALTILTAAVVLAGYYLVPGLIIVFGLTLPAALTSQDLWSTGLLRPPATPGPTRPAPTVGPAARTSTAGVAAAS
ncbi:YesL family protein [Pseudactinotalea sp. Z1748]|uniref:YesL family protein n=1 Tax=Pseudactinotalea sp. Z1748 TaxID=3413027 RepID=UPI003C7A02E4